MADLHKLHADQFTTNSVTIEYDEVQSCCKLLQAVSYIDGNNIDLNKTIICKIVLECFTYLLKEFKHVQKCAKQVN